MVTTEPGSKIIVDFDIENTGGTAGDGQDITLTTEDSTKVTVDTLEDFTVNPGDIESGVLEWKTYIDQAQEQYQLCIETEDTTDCVDVSVIRIDPKLEQTLFAATSEALYGLTLDTLTEEISSVQTGGFGGICFNDGILFGARTSSNSPNVFAIDAETGNNVWTRGISESATMGIIVKDGALYTGGNGAGLYRLEENTGDTVWNTTLSSVSSFASPSYYDGSIIIGNNNGQIESVRASDGQIEWTTDTVAGSTIRNAAAIVDDTIFQGNSDGEFYALDPSDGSIEWVNDTSAVDGLHTLKKSIYEGNIFITDGDLYTLDSSNGEEGYRLTDAEYRSTYVADDVLYAGKGNDMLVALEPDTGNEIWSTQMNDRISIPPAFIGGTLYAIDQSGELYTIDVSDGTITGGTVLSGIGEEIITGADGWSFSSRRAKNDNNIPLPVF